MRSALALCLLMTCCKGGKGQPTDAAVATSAASTTPAPTKPAVDAAQLGKLLRQGAAGDTTTVAVASIFAAQNLEGFTDVESTEPSVIAIQEGTIAFNEKRLPANVMKATFVTVNREAGKKRTLCILIAGAYDAEFSMWRSVIGSTCESTAALKDIAKWKKRNSFVLEAASGEAVPEPPASPYTMETVHAPANLPGHIVCNDTAVAWTERSGGDAEAIWLYEKGASRLLLDKARSYYIALTDQAVVYSTLDGDVVRVDRATAATKTLASHQNDPRGIVADDQFAYWANFGDLGQANGSIMKVPLAGGAPVPVARAQSQPMELALSSTDLFWETDSERRLFERTNQSVAQGRRVARHSREGHRGPRSARHRRRQLFLDGG